MEEEKQYINRPYIKNTANGENKSKDGESITKWKYRLCSAQLFCESLIKLDTQMLPLTPWRTLPVTATTDLRKTIFEQVLNHSRFDLCNAK